VEVVRDLVAADGVHIGEEALADVEFIALEREALPLGERMHDLGVFADVGNVEADRALVAVQVVVEAGIFLDEERRGDAAQIERLPQIDLEAAFDEFNGPLHLIDGQRRAVPLRNNQIAHKKGPRFPENTSNIIQ
jgi:hypothetical protein